MILRIFGFCELRLLIFNMHACSVTSVMSDSLQSYGPWPTRLLCPWHSPGKNTGVSCHVLLQGTFLIQELNPCLLNLLHCRQIPYPVSQLGSPIFNIVKDKTEENLNSYLLIHLKTILKKIFMLTKLKYIYENCFPKAKYIWLAEWHCFSNLQLSLTSGFRVNSWILVSASAFDLMQ